MSGRKNDDGKAPMHLIAPEFMFALANVLGYGAKKYSDRNWEEGMDWSRVFSATQRHIWAWWGGEDFDPESGFSHLWHAAFGIMVLIAYDKRNNGTDDRSSHSFGNLHSSGVEDLDKFIKSFDVSDV